VAFTVPSTTCLSSACLNIINKQRPKPAVNIDCCLKKYQRIFAQYYYEEKTNMKIVVLQAAGDGCEYEDDDSPADVGCHLTRAAAGGGRGGCSPEAAAAAVEVENVELTPQNYAPKLVELAKRFHQFPGEVDCFVNLCDGAWDEPSVGIDVVELLENKLNLPYTGADLNFYEPTRLQMKKVALACGVQVPAWRFLYSHEALEQFLSEFDDDAGQKPPPLRFPLLPKHFSSYSSVGLTRQSKCNNVEELREQCRRMLDRFGGCLVEEFVEGREFTVLVAQVPAATADNNGNNESGTGGIDVVAYEPVECRFGVGEEFKHYELKWVDYDSMTWVGIEDADLAERLKDLAVKVFRGMNGRGYGRLDVRSDPAGENLYFLEINPNCGVFYPEGLYGSADFILDRADPVRAHADFLLSQVEVAKRLWKAKNERNSVFETRYDARTKSWGLFALRDVQEGEIVQRNEEAALHLVSKAHVLRHWAGLNDEDADEGVAAEKACMRTWRNFATYCWPVSDSLYAMWDPEPDNWKPINHSCDPNAWQEEGNGLNLVARRSIAKGEEITVDYATFVGYFPEMKSFPCECRAAACRGEISGMDIVKHPGLSRRYEGHTTDYVARKAKEFFLSPLAGAVAAEGGSILTEAPSSSSSSSDEGSSLASSARPEDLLVAVGGPASN